MVESQFSKLIVAGSSPVLRSVSNGSVSEWPIETAWNAVVL